MLFELWKHKGMQFLATGSNPSVHVVDDQGNNYGVWFTFEYFKTEIKKDNSIVIVLGKAQLSVRAI